MIFQYLDLPHVPRELLTPIDAIIASDRLPRAVTWPFFIPKPITNDLAQWLARMFTFEFDAQYQVITQELGIHKDVGRIAVLNYLLSTGGDPYTRVYDNAGKEIAKMQLEPERWHFLRTSNYHSVDKLNSTRISLSLKIINLEQFEEWWRYKN